MCNKSPVRSIVRVLRHSTTAGYTQPLVTYRIFPDLDFANFQQLDVEPIQKFDVIIASII